MTKTKGASILATLVASTIVILIVEFGGFGPRSDSFDRIGFSGYSEPSGEVIRITISLGPRTEGPLLIKSPISRSYTVAKSEAFSGKVAPLGSTARVFITVMRNGRVIINRHQCTLSRPCVFSI